MKCVITIVLIALALAVIVFTIITGIKFIQIALHMLPEKNSPLITGEIISQSDSNIFFAFSWPLVEIKINDKNIKAIVFSDSLIKNNTIEFHFSGNFEKTYYLPAEEWSIYLVLGFIGLLSPFLLFLVNVFKPKS